MLTILSIAITFVAISSLLFAYFYIRKTRRFITARKIAEEQLQLEKNNLQSIIDAMQYGLSIINLDYGIIYQNDVLSNIYGRKEGKCYEVYEGKDKVCDG